MANAAGRQVGIHTCAMGCFEEIESDKSIERRRANQSPSARFGSNNNNRIMNVVSAQIWFCLAVVSSID